MNLNEWKSSKNSFQSYKIEIKKAIEWAEKTFMFNVPSFFYCRFFEVTGNVEMFEWIFTSDQQGSLEVSYVHYEKQEQTGNTDVCQCWKWNCGMDSNSVILFWNLQRPFKA